jgi:hypothetical protein
MSFRRRTFPELLESMLTTITGGVAAETHPFPPPDGGPPFLHNLERPPAASVVSVYGSRDGQPRAFRKDVDYKLSDDGRQLAWQTEGAELPDPGTLVDVSYTPAGADARLTDLGVGSVLRTLAESTALELARLYAQLDAVYQAGFIDTATGSSLDNVVALLGMERVQGGRPAGEVEFTRAPGSAGEITIPAGTRIATPDRNVEYETTETIALAPGQTTIRVVARDLEPNEPLADADRLTVLPVPIYGVGGVTNPAPTAVTAQDETDDDLRVRAKNFLHGSERATVGALVQAVSHEGITADVDEPETPGFVKITPHAEAMPPELQQRLLTAIRDARPAGVRVTLEGARPQRRVDLELRLTTSQGLLAQDLRGAQREVRERISKYFERLEVRAPASINQIVGLALAVKGVEDVRIVRATWNVDGETVDVLDREAGQLKIAGAPTALGELHISDPNLPTLLNVTIAYPEGQDAPNTPAIRAALADALTYLNGVNATEGNGGTEPQRVVSYGKLLYALPLPPKPAQSLPSADAAPGTELPDEGDVAPYDVKFVLTLESGLSQILSAGSDAYRLTPFERISLGGVEATTGGGGA